MQLISFWYDKTANSNSKLRVVAVKSSDNSYIHGYDMLDNKNYKQFLRSKIHGPILHLGEEPENTLLGGKIVTTEDLLAELGYAGAGGLLKEFYLEDREIADVYYNKTKKRIASIGNGYFFLYGPASADIQLVIHDKCVTMQVSEGVIEFAVDGKGITLLEFTRMILGITK